MTGQTPHRDRLPRTGPDPGRRAAGTPLMTATRLIARGLARTLCRLDVAGAGSVPRTGGLLLAVNHQTLLDGPIVYGLVPRPAVFLIKAEVFAVPVVGAVLRAIGQVPVRRGMAERTPLQTALGVLAAGGVVGVFPEGTRGAGGADRVAPGIAYLALRSGCPVVPVACHGTATVLPAGQILPRWRRPVRVVFGPSFTVADGAGDSTGEVVPLPAGGDRRRQPAHAGRQRVAAAADRVQERLAAHVAATRPGTGAATSGKDPLR